MLRAQITNPSLFSMPAGDAGLAVVAEYGKQKWNYDPDPRYMNGQTFAFTATAGGGKRSRYALTSELRVPVLKPLTLTASGRYDAYRVSGETVDKATYMLGLELRPVRSLLVRGRYGTAFKAPTLSDEFQGVSGFYQLIPDYYQCQQNGFDFAHATDCLYYDYYFGNTSGNTALKPINAKVWDVGLVFAPLRGLVVHRRPAATGTSTMRSRSRTPTSCCAMRPVPARRARSRARIPARLRCRRSCVTQRRLHPVVPHAEDQRLEREDPRPSTRRPGL